MEERASIEVRFEIVRGRGVNAELPERSIVVMENRELFSEYREVDVAIEAIINLLRTLGYSDTTIGDYLISAGDTVLDN